MEALIKIEKHSVGLHKQLHFLWPKTKNQCTADFPKLTELQTASNDDDILTKHCNSDKQASEFIRAEIIN